MLFINRSRPRRGPVTDLVLLLQRLSSKERLQPPVYRLRPLRNFTTVSGTESGMQDRLPDFLSI